jgi:hypothetical protein
VIRERINEIPIPTVPIKPETIGFHFIPNKPATKNTASGMSGISKVYEYPVILIQFLKWIRISVH